MEEFHFEAFGQMAGCQHIGKREQKLAAKHWNTL